MAAEPEVTEGRTIGVLRRQLEAALAERDEGRAERDEGRAEQAALAEVLRAINGASGDFGPVFDLIVARATALCDAPSGSLVSIEGNHARALAFRDTPKALADYWVTPQYVDPNTGMGKVLRQGRTIHDPDMAASEPYRNRAPMAVSGVELGGIRSTIMVPLVNERGVIGIFVIWRTEARPFDERQIALLESFAAQAMLAMENARLLTEQREALEQQTATAEVLGVINASPGDLAPVFDAILDKARKLCSAAYGDLWIYDGEVLHLAATQGEPGFAAWLRAQGPVPVWPGSPTELLMQGADHVQYEDPVRDGHYAAVPQFLAQVERAGIRSTLFVPMWKDGALLGVIIVYRREVRRFDGKQVSVLQGFAAQAVIAMENARLINETREALAQQTATTEVLEVINASPGNLEPVLSAMLEKAMRLCEAAFGIFGRFDGKLFEPAVDRGVPAELISATRQIQSPPPNSGLGRIAAGESVVQLVDLANTDVYRSGFVGATALVDIGGAKTAIFVALRKDGVLLGVIVMYRREVRAFSDKQVALLQNFAAQAVIAMENARLLTEQREALEQQTATGNILRVISQSPTDVQPVLDAVAKAAVRFCGAADALVSLREGSEFRFVAKEGPLSVELGRREVLDRETSMGRSILDGRTCHLPDIAALDSVEWAAAQRLSAEFGQRAALAAPMIRDGVAIGSIALRKPERGPFTLRQIALLEAFAAQAVIAIENVRLFTELRESLDQQTATTEVLQVISQSPTDVEPVLKAVVAAARRFCGAEHADIFLREGNDIVAGPHDGPISSQAIGQRDPLNRDASRGVTILDGRTTHIPDIQALAPDEYPLAQSYARRFGFRATVNAPMLRDGVAIGCVTLRKPQPGAFTPRQIQLLETFAAQAVIAIENVRLFTELKESLDQQTATSDILRVISQSPTDVQPVLNVVVKAAQRFCGAEDVVISLRHGDELAIAAHDGPIEAPPPRRKLDRSSTQGRAVIDARTIHLPDIAQVDPAEWSAVIALSQRLGAKASLAAPMLREGTAVGAIMLRRREAGPFTERQMALLEAFAAQAVIAIENIRLFTELREALDQQTATAEVLESINRSPGDLQPVFDAIVSKAMVLCDAAFGMFNTFDGERYHTVATLDVPEAYARFRAENPPDYGPETAPGRLIAGEDIIQVADMADSDLYRNGDPNRRAIVELGGARTILNLALRREGKLRGMIAIYRQEMKPFADQQITLVQGFATQAVIAMENARLLSELRESLEQQTATSDILRVISQSPTDVAPVLEAVVKGALRFCGAEDAVVLLREGEQWLIAGHEGPMVAEVGARQSLSRQTAPGQAMLDGVTTHFPDIAALDLVEFAGAYEFARRHGFRAALAAPMLREGAPIGAIALRRSEAGAFTPRQIELLESFAAQAVIALENTRLFTELRQRTDDLSESLEYQTATSELLEVISRSAADIQPVFDTMLASAARLCGVEKGDVAVLQGEVFRHVAFIGCDPDELAWLKARVTVPGRGTSTARALLDRRIDHVLDQSLDPERVAPKEATRKRTTLAVPLLRDGEPLGVISLLRDHVEPFSERQIALIETFADQAVIAMENARLLGELRESLDQQTATAEILRVINSSPGNLTPVFQAILEKAHSTCGAEMGTLFAWDGTHVRAVATLGYDAEIDEILRKPHTLIPAMVGLLSGQRFFHRVYEQDRASEGPHEFGPRFLAGSRIRTNLIIPLRKDDTVLGFISANRREVRPYSDKEIALLESFAAQAVIAMENARLLTELRQRTDDLSESLDYQTATSELLEVISRSTSDIQPVLDTLLASAARLCVAGISGVVVKQGDSFWYRALIGGTSGLFDALRAQPIQPSRGTIAGHALLARDLVHVPDIHTYPDYSIPEVLKVVRTALGVPLLREGELLGAIVLTRDRVEPFSERQIALVRTFADQAVIAIENARLLGELTRREEELRVTFDHMGDGVAMFDADLKLASWNRNFQELLDIPDSFLSTRPGLDDYVRLLAERGELGGGNADEEIARYHERANAQWSLERTRPDGRILEVRNNPVPGGGAVLIYSDITERKKAEAEIAATRDAAEAALERQTATADILKVIASSPSDTQPAFDAIAESANRLLGGLTTAVWRFQSERAHLAAFTSIGPEADAALKSLSPLRIADFTELAPVVAGEVTQQANIEAMSPAVHEVARKRGYHSQLLVPLLARGRSIGFFSVTRASPGGFSEEDVQLLQTFADQATIAIENARLFNDLRDSLERLKAAQANLVQSEKMATLGQLTAGIAHEIKNPLNFVNNFASLSVELLDELKEVAGPALDTLDGDKRAELDETMSMLVSNLGKITEHGKRADGIVRSMLSHSRGGAGDWQPSDINALVEEALNLAYHGARAQDKEFNVTLERDLEKTGQPIDVVPQDVTRVFLNLFGNGFYAANKRRLSVKEGAREAGFRPTIKVTTRDLGDGVEVKVRDNGTGIPPEVREKLFQPFFTTKPTGEGTGLGLSISYDIVTQQHGGTIEVESEPGSFTEFTVRLPRSRRAKTNERAL